MGKEIITQVIGYKKEIIWSIIFLFGVIILYSYGLKNSLMTLRIDKGIVSCDSSELYSGNVQGFTTKDKIINNFKLLLLSSVIMLIILGIFINCTSVNFNSFSGIMMASIELLLITFGFAESPIDGVFDKDKKYEVIFTLFGKIKKSLLLKIVNKEYEIMRCNNKILLKRLVKENDYKIGILIINLNGKTFLKVLPKDISTDSCEELKINCKEVAEAYLDNYSEVYEELKYLFDEDLLLLGTRICDISEYLNDTCDTISELTTDQIKTTIKRRIKAKGASTTKQVVKQEYDVDTLMNNCGI